MAKLKMPSMNRVFLQGRLTRDPELHYTQQGAAIVNFGIAVSRIWKDKAGQKQEETYWGECRAWNGIAENVARFMKKGDPVQVEGRLVTDTWKSKDGENRSRTRIDCQFVTALSWPDEDRGSNDYPEGLGGNEPEPVADEQSDDDIPF